MKRKAATTGLKTLTIGERTAAARKTRSTAATISTARHQRAFREVLALIEQARQRAFQAVNTELIDLYWHADTSKIQSRLADHLLKAFLITWNFSALCSLS